MHKGSFIGLATLAAALCTAPTAQAQGVSVASRETIQSGNFLVGFATAGDSGSDLRTFTTPDASFANIIGDSGGVDELFGDTPVSGSGSFSSAQSYAVSTPPVSSLVTFEGNAITAVSTPYSYVSVGANALSQLDLLLALAVPMVFELEVQVIEVTGATVNGLTPRADASVKLSGPGDNWLFNNPGSFVENGVLSAGQWRINAFADTRGNGSATFLGTLTLTPVPEPATALLMALGLAGLVAWRKWSSAGAT